MEEGLTPLLNAPYEERVAYWNKGFAPLGHLISIFGGYASLGLSSNISLLKRRGGRGSREGFRPSLTYTPLPLLREGGQGDRSLKIPQYRLTGSKKGCKIYVDMRI